LNDKKVRGLKNVVLQIVLYFVVIVFGLHVSRETFVDRSTACIYVHDEKTPPWY
jgi:hypothetical protein